MLNSRSRNNPDKLIEKVRPKNLGASSVLLTEQTSDLKHIFESAIKQNGDK